MHFPEDFPIGRHMREPDDEAVGYGPPTKTCRICRMSGLVWGQRGERWRLCLPSGEEHQCGKQDRRRRSSSILRREHDLSL